MYIGFPITKVDEERRQVWGYATVEELDKQGDIVDFNASVDAFRSWPGNIREQHDPRRAVGKAIEVVPDADRRAIWVGAYISRGAEDTWQKVKDGTLKGFSIGGRVLEAKPEVIKSGSRPRTANRITKFRLDELSLVDNPACPSATIQMVKSADGGLVATDVLETNPPEAAAMFIKNADGRILAYTPDGKFIGEAVKNDDVAGADADRDESMRTFIKVEGTELPSSPTTLQKADDDDPPAHRPPDVIELGILQKEAFTQEYVDNLPDSAFLYIARDGGVEKRYFPYRDADGRLDFIRLAAAVRQIPTADLPGLSDADRKAMSKRAHRMFRDAQAAIAKDMDVDHGFDISLALRVIDGINRLLQSEVDEHQGEPHDQEQLEQLREAAQTLLDFVQNEMNEYYGDQNVPAVAPGGMPSQAGTPLGGPGGPGPAGAPVGPGPSAPPGPAAPAAPPTPPPPPAAPPAPPMPGGPVQKALDASEMEKVQRVHDYAVALGAACLEKDHTMPADEDDKDDKHKDKDDPFAGDDKEDKGDMDDETKIGQEGDTKGETDMADNDDLDYNDEGVPRDVRGSGKVDDADDEPDDDEDQDVKKAATATTDDHGRTVTNNSGMPSDKGTPPPNFPAGKFPKNDDGLPASDPPKVDRREVVDGSDDPPSKEGRVVDNNNGNPSSGGRERGHDASDYSALAKTIAVSVEQSVEKAISGALGGLQEKVDALEKATGDLAKVADQVTVLTDLVQQLEGRVVKLEEQPAPGGPILHAVEKSLGYTPMGSGASDVDTQIEVLSKMQDEETNPIARERLGFKIAQLMLKKQMGGS